MREPNDDLAADPDERADAPDFDVLTPPEELVRGERTRDDFFDAVLHLDDPAPVDEVAELAGHGSDAAREYLDWFERMGIVERIGDRPATYRLNREYLTWRRVQRVRDEYEPADIVDYLEREAERDREFETRFGVDDPGDVSVTEYAAAAATSIETVWWQLSEWQTTRRRIEILERALRADDGSASGPRRRSA